MALICLTILPSGGWAETYFEASQRLLESGHETEARRALRQELRLRPRNFEARYDLAVLLARIGHEAEALHLYEDNMKRGWHLPTVVNLSAIYSTQGRRDKATQLLKEATRKFRSEAVPWYLLAKIAESGKQLKLGEKYYRRALKADRKNGFAHIRYARFLAGHNHMRKAKKHAVKAIHLLPRCAACFKIAGDILKQSGEKKRALIAYQKSAALQPGRAIRRDIIAMLDALGEHQRATTMKHGLKHKP